MRRLQNKGKKRRTEAQELMSGREKGDKESGRMRFRNYRK